MAKDYIHEALKIIAPKYALKRQRSMEAVRRYEAAASGHRWDGWGETDSTQNVNVDVQRDLGALRKRSRHIYQNDPYGKRTPFLIANNVVGTGIVATPTLPKAQEKALKGIKELWNSWANKTHADFYEKLNFGGLQHLVLRTVVISGEAFVIRKRVPSQYNPFGFQLQVLESEYLDQNKFQTITESGGSIWYGIEFNKWQKIIGYHIYDKHPYEAGAETRFVSVDDVCHVYFVERSGQYRGVPWNASTLLKQRDLSDYEDAELYGKKSAAAFTAVVTNTSPESISDDGTSSTDDRFDNLQPGTITYLKPGENIAFPQQPQNGAFPAYVQTQYQAIAAGLGITYEALTGNLGNVNFSSGRMGWIEMHRNIQEWQSHLMIPQFCDKVWGWFIDQMKMLGNIPKDAEVGVTWTCPRREMIDPVKEIAGTVKALRAGLISYPEAIKQLGFDPDQIINENSFYKKAFEAAGIKADWNIEFDVAYAQLQQAAQMAKAKPAATV